MGFACFQTAIQFFTLVNAMVFIKQHQIKAKTCQPRKDFQILVENIQTPYYCSLLFIVVVFTLIYFEFYIFYLKKKVIKLAIYRTTLKFVYPFNMFL